MKIKISRYFNGTGVPVWEGESILEKVEVMAAQQCARA